MTLDQFHAMSQMSKCLGEKYIEENNEKKEYYKMYKHKNIVVSIDGRHFRPVSVAEHFVYDGPSSFTIKVDRRSSNELKEGPVNSCLIKNVVFNPPATIVFWIDGTKTVVKANGGDQFDPEKGLAMAIAKKAFGNKGAYFNVFKHYNHKYVMSLLKDEIHEYEDARIIETVEHGASKKPGDDSCQSN